MYFMIKDEKFVDEYMKIWEKVSNALKKNNSELVCNKKYVKAEKNFNATEILQCFYILVILIDSVYKKDEHYYPKVFLEKVIHNVFRRSIRNF